GIRRLVLDHGKADRFLRVPAGVFARAGSGAGGIQRAESSGRNPAGGMQRAESGGRRRNPAEAEPGRDRNQGGGIRRYVSGNAMMARAPGRSAMRSSQRSTLGRAARSTG